MNQKLNSKLINTDVLPVGFKYPTGQTDVPLKILHTYWDVPIFTFLSVKVAEYIHKKNSKQ